MKELTLTEQELYTIARGLQCLSFMMDRGFVTYNGDATEETVNARIDTIARKIADATGIDLSDEAN